MSQQTAIAFAAVILLASDIQVPANERADVAKALLVLINGPAPLASSSATGRGDSSGDGGRDVEIERARKILHAFIDTRIPQGARLLHELVDGAFGGMNFSPRVTQFLGNVVADHLQMLAHWSEERNAPTIDSFSMGNNNTFNINLADRARLFVTVARPQSETLPEPARSEMRKALNQMEQQAGATATDNSGINQSAGVVMRILSGLASGVVSNALWAELQSFWMPK